MTRIAVTLAVACVIVGSACRRPGHHQVEIQGLAYRPDTIYATLGDSISWVNRDFVPHNVMSDIPGMSFSHLEADSTATVVVATPDTVKYWCSYHPTMTGLIVVKQ